MYTSVYYFLKLLFGFDLQSRLKIGRFNLSNRWGIPENIEAAVLKRDTNCVYCGCQFSSERSKKRSWEHIINDINIATLENIALCCVGCNASKGAKPLQVWLDSENAKRRGITERTLSEVVKQALSNSPRWNQACEKIKGKVRYFLHKWKKTQHKMLSLLEFWWR